MSEQQQRQWEDRAWELHVDRDEELSARNQKRRALTMSGAILTGFGGAMFLAWGLSYPFSVLGCLGSIGGSCGVYDLNASESRAYTLGMTLGATSLILVGIPLIILGAIEKSKLNDSRVKHFRAHPVVGPGTAGLGFQGRF